MKAKLTFNLPEENQEFKLASNAQQLQFALWDYSQWIDGKWKYSDKDTLTVEEVREAFIDACNDNGLNLDIELFIDIQKKPLIKRSIERFFPFSLHFKRK